MGKAQKPAARVAWAMLLVSRIACTPYDAGEDAADSGVPPSEPNVGDATLPIEAGSDAGSDPVCTPKRAFVPFSTGAGSGLACNVDGVLPGATAPAGLDYLDISNWGSLDGMNVTACVAVEMPSRVSEVRVRASAVVQGCTRPCSGSYCGTEGWRAHVYVGKVGESLHWIAKLALSPTPAEYALPIAEALRGPHIVVCRTSANINAEDVAVHAITGVCEP